MKKYIYILFTLLFICRSYSQTVINITSPPTGSFTVPCGVTTLTVECWGGGGGGGGSTSALPGNAGSGGGGGGFVIATIPVTPSAVISYTVGASGTGIPGGTGTNGGTTTFNTSTPVVANGGVGGNPNGGISGAGGTGNGGTVTPGSNGLTGTGTSGGAGGNCAGGGGNGGAGGTSGTNGGIGSNPGGGGGGSGAGANLFGGSGGGGRIRISYMPFVPTIITAENLPAQTLCANQPPGSLSITVSGTGPHSFQWFKNTVASNTGGTIMPTETNQNLLPDMSIIGTTYYYCVVTSPCDDDTSNVSGAILVKPVPTVTAMADHNICQNLTDNLTASAAGGSGAGYVFDWYNVATGGTSLGSGNPFTSAPLNTPGIANFFVEVTDGAGCKSPRDNVQVTVDPRPSLTSVSSSTICSGLALNQNLTADIGGSVFTWNAANNANVTGETTAATSTGIVSDVLVSTNHFASEQVTYFIYATFNGCQGPTQTYTANVLPAPNPPPVSSFANVTCNGLNDGQVQFSAITGGSGGPNFYSIDNVSYQATGSFSPLAPGTYNGYAKDGTGCISNTTTAFTITEPAILSGSVSTTSVSCFGGSNGSVTVTPSGGTSTYQYSINGGAYGGSAVFSGLAAGNHFVNVQDANACVSSNIPFTITEPPTAVNLTIGGNSTVCSSNALGITLTPSGGTPGYTFQWLTLDNSSTTGESVAAVSTNLINDVVTNITTTVQSLTYTVTLLDANSCVATNTVTATIHAKPSITNALAASSCSGVSFSQALSSSVSPATFTWVATDNTNTSGESTSIQSTSTIIESVINLTGSTQTVLYTLVPTVTATSCSGSPETFTLSVNPLPIINVSATTNPICNGSSTSLTATGGNTYSWNPTGSLSASSGSPVTASPTSSTTYTVVGTNTLTTCSNTATIPLNVTPNSIGGTITGISTICEGSSTGNLNLVGQTGAVLTWELNYNGGGFNAIAGTSGLSTYSEVPSLGPGTYQYRAQVQNSPCPPVFSSIKTITVNPTPVASPTSNSPVCENSQLDLFANTIVGATYSWSGPNGFSSAAQNPSIASVALIDSGNYTLTITLSGCTSIPVQTNVIVNPIPLSPGIGSNSPVCLNDTLNLFTPFVGGATYNWTGPNTFSSNVQNPQILNASSTSMGTYSLSINVAGCNSAVVTTNVVINPIPNFTIVAPSTICEGETLSLTVSGVSGGSTFNYIWNGPGAFNFSGLNPTRPGILLGHAGYYIVNSINNFGCSKKDSINILVFQKPNAIVTGGPNAICAYDTAFFNGSSSLSGAGSITAYQWINGSTIITGANSVNFTTSNPGNYFLEVTNTNGCKDTSFVNAVTLKNMPTAVIGGANSFCSGTGFNLDGNSSTAGGTASLSSFAWLNNNVIVSGATTIAETFTIGGNYQIIVTNTDNCKDTSGVIFVSELFPPATPNLILSTSNYCLGDSVYVSIQNPTAAHSYSWLVTPANITLSSSTDTAIYVGGEVAGTYTLQVTETDLSSCVSSPGGTVITVNGLPNVGITFSTQNVCAGSTVTLAGNGATSYLWTNGVTDNVAFSPTATMLYTVTGTDANSCVNSDTITVYVNSLPTITANASNNNVCPGTPISLTASGGNSYVWSNGSGSAVTVVFPPLSTSFTVTGTNAGGCSDTAVVNLNILPKPPLPIASTSSGTECLNSPVTLSSNAAAANNFWFNTATNVSLSNLASFTHTESVAGNYTYGLYVQSPAGCNSDTATVTVVFNPCLTSLANEFISIVANSSYNGNILTNDGNPIGFTTSGTPISGPLNGSFNISNTGAFTYIPNSGFSGYDIVVTQACSPSSVCFNDTIFIVVNPLATFDYGVVSGIIVGSQLAGNVLINDAGTSLGNVTLTSNVAYGSLTLSANGNFVYTPAAGYCGVDSFQYQVCDINSLCANAYGIIDVNCDTEIITHNAFSPNNDGKNDLWILGNIDNTENSVTILDRWGNEVWRGINYDNVSTVWDGKNASGTPLPAGTYFYLIIIKDKAPQRGWIELTK